MNKIAIATLITARLAGAAIAVNEHQIQTTSKEIVFFYSAPEQFTSSDACTVKASRKYDFASGYQPAEDVDDLKFPGSNLDTRNPQLIEQRFRTFVLGKDIAERGADGFVYSRALKAATTYYIQLTCGAETAVFSASTKTVPFGLTRGEALPADPLNPGEYLHPSRKWSVSGQKIIDPEYGTELSFPEAAGSRASNTFTVGFKEAIGTAWNSPASSLTDDGASASISGSLSPLFLRWNHDAASFGASTFASFDASGLDFLKLNIKGMGSATAPEDRTVQVAITFDSINAASPWYDVILPTSQGAVAAGSGVPGDTLQTKGAKPFSRVRMARKSGSFTYVASTKVVTLTEGSTSEDWVSGTRFRISEAPIDIVDATAGTPPTITTAAAHGLSSGNTVVVAGVTGSIAASVNGTWTITVTGPNTLTLNGVSATGTYSSPNAICHSAPNGPGGGTAQTIPGSPPTLYIPNAFWLTGTKAKLNGFTSPGWTNLNGNTYTLSQSNGSSEHFTVDGASTSGTYSQTNLDSPNCTTAGLYATATRLTGTVQRNTDYPIASVDSATQMTLSSGPQADIVTAQNWSVDAFGFLIRKKTTSPDIVYIQHASATYQTSAGTSWKPAGGPIFNTATVTGPGGKPGRLGYFGNTNVFVSTDGSTTSAYGNIRPHEELILYGQGNDCVGSLGTGESSNMGQIGINPNYPNRVYCLLLNGRDRTLVVADYVGDYRQLDPTKGQNSYYPNYSGYPTVPNCNGYGGIYGTNAPVALPSGTPCVRYYTPTGLKALIATYGEEKWRKLNTTLANVQCGPDQSAAFNYNATTGHVEVAMKCNTGQDTAGVVYVFSIDDNTKVPTPVGEIATWNRTGTRWSQIHGGTTPTPVVDGRLVWVPHPMNVDATGIINQYKAILMDDTGLLRGPWWFTYTSVNGNPNVDMDASGPNGLQSCAAWSDSPLLPTPTPDGISLIDGHVAGCTTITIEREPCDESLGADEQAIVAADTQTHLSKCGKASARWLQDIEVGDYLLHYEPANNNFLDNEYMLVIAKTGSGPGATLVLYRGGNLRGFWFDNGADQGATPHAGEGRRLVAWSSYSYTNGLYPAYFVNYGDYPTGTLGGERMDYSPGHGQITRTLTVGSINGAYGVVTGSYEARRTKIKDDFSIPNMLQFQGRSSNDVLSVDSHVTYVPGANNSNAYDFMLDGRPWNGYDGVPGTPVPGTASVYKWTPASRDVSLYTHLYPKHLPVAARAGNRVLRTISGPDSVIDDSKPYTYCFALVAGECRTDSQAGDFYMAAPKVTDAGSVSQCCGKDKAGVRDLAFTSATSIVSRYTQTLLVPLMTGGGTRALTSGFDQYRVEDSFKNWSIVSSGTTSVGRTRGLENVKSEIWTLEMPPIALDSWDRSKYIEYPIEVPRYPGALQAIVEFGYARYGNPAANQYFCMDRLDSCLVGQNQSDAEPFTFGIETSAWAACQNGCTINVPVVGNRVLYYRVKYRKGVTTIYTSPQRVLTTP